jgi:Rap1a immunity proteins
MFPMPKRMQMRWVTVLGALLAGSATALAAQTGRIDNARSLEIACRPVDQKIQNSRRKTDVPLVSGMLCLGYMQAMQDLSVLTDEEGRRALGSCPSTDITLRQLIQAFLTYARAHRDDLDENAAVGVIKAFRAAFPCPPEPSDTSSVKKLLDTPQR